MNGIFGADRGMVALHCLWPSGLRSQDLLAWPGMNFLLLVLGDVQREKHVIPLPALLAWRTDHLSLGTYCFPESRLPNAARSSWSAGCRWQHGVYSLVVGTFISFTCSRWSCIWWCLFATRQPKFSGWQASTAWLGQWERAISPPCGFCHPLSARSCSCRTAVSGGVFTRFRSHLVTLASLAWSRAGFSRPCMPLIP